MRPMIVAATIVAALLATGSAAVAQADTPASAPTIELRLERAVGATAPLTARGTRLRIRGIVRPYVPGQQVTVRIQQGSSKLRVKAMTVYEPAGTAHGEFVLGFTPTHTGVLRIRASHLATPELGTAVAHDRYVRVVKPSAQAGAQGPSVRLLQRLLDDQGYVTGSRGTFDARTGRAVLTFRKVSGLERTQLATEDVYRRLLAGGGAFKVRYPSHGRHVEGDLTHQVIALIDHGTVQRIYPISSGKPSTPTVLGNFKVYRKDPGTNAKGMVFSSYFTGGYAIHGYVDVPVFPASHGCLRTPVPDAVPIFDWIKMGDRVDVYYRDAEHPKNKRVPNPGP
jgi:hypothetical protein